jgi:type IV pilus assembly protein PilV
MSIKTPTGAVRHRCRGAHGGFTLIEVLIAVLILAIGLLGLAGLQTFSLQSNVHAYQRSQATTLAYEILDAMRANRDVALAGGYDLAFGDIPAGASISDQDRIAWRQRIVALLPAGDASIQPQGGGIYTVSIQWDDSKGVDNLQTFTVTTQL